MRNKDDRFNDSTYFPYTQYMYTTIYVLVSELVAVTEVRTAVLSSQNQLFETVVITELVEKYQ